MKGKKNKKTNNQAVIRDIKIRVEEMGNETEIVSELIKSVSKVMNKYNLKTIYAVQLFLSLSALFLAKYVEETIDRRIGEILGYESRVGG